MNELVQSQTDYIYFVYGLSAIIVAAVCYRLQKAVDARFPWMWLGVFALLRGLAAWAVTWSYSFGGGNQCEVARLVLTIAAFTALVEFGRAATMRLRGKTPGVWIHFVLLGLTALGLRYGIVGLAASSRYALGVVGGVWGASVAFGGARRCEGGTRIALRRLGYCLFLAAAANAIPNRAPFFPASVINREAFARIAHFPLDMLVAAVTVCICIYLLTHSGTFVPTERRTPTLDRFRRRIAAWTTICIFVTIAGGWVIAQAVGNGVDKSIRTSLLARSLSTAAAIDAQAISSFQGSGSDWQNPRYTALMRQLRDVRKCNEDCRFLYIMGLRNHKVVFLLDTEPTSSKDWSPPGQVYTDPSEAMAKALKTSGKFIEGPVTDKWGTWLSSIVSLTDKKTGRPTAVLGMDMNAAQWRRAITCQRLVCMLVVLLVCIITVTFSAILHTSHESNARIAESESHYRGLVESSSSWISLFDREGRFLTINQAGRTGTGWSESYLIGKPFVGIWPEAVRGSAADAIKKVLSGSRCSFEADCLGPNGSVLNWDVVLNPIVDGDGHVKRFVGIFTDIGDRRRAEQDLQESQRRLSTLLSNLPGMAYRCANDSQWTMEFVSDGCLELTGYMPSQLVGEQGIPFDQLIHAEDRKYVQDEVQAAVENNRSFRLTYRIVTASGEERWVWEQGRAVSSDSSGRCVLEGFIADINEKKSADEALLDSERRYRLLAENVRDVIWTANTSLEFTFGSPSTFGLLGYTPEELTNLTAEDVLSPTSYGDLSRLVADLRQAEAVGTDALEAHTRELEIVRKDGGTIWTENEISLLRTSSGEVTGILGIARDISRRKAAEGDLKIQTSAINAASDYIVITNVNGEIEFVNAAFERDTGYQLQDIRGRKPSILKSGQQDSEFYRQLWERVLAGETWQGEIVNRRKDGSIYVEDMSITPVKNEDGVIEHFIAIKRDITDKKVYERKLDHLAHHDHLTGLPNRLLFSDRLTQSIAQAHRKDKRMAVMFLDLDRFKYINDTLGHNVGDQLLKQAAHRLSLTVRKVDTIARMGGDEFTVILSDIETATDAAKVAKKVLDALAKPFQVDGEELFISASIGISVYPTDGLDVETMVRNADAAMYRAKEQGRNTYHLYTDALNTAAVERLTLANSLRKAVERNEFIVHFQPRVDIKTGKILGAEALVRWQHPEMGIIPPSQFIPLAEETGLIIPLSEWVLRQSCFQNQKWIDKGYDPIDIAVNISGKHVEHRGLKSTIVKVLKESGLDPSHLEMELTESTLMQNPDHAISVLTKIKQMGVKISIDDFGTGYSSLSYLKQFPVDAVKIDQSFVRDVTTDPDDAAIAGAVVAMAHSLKLKVIAEGVETIQQLEFLRDLNCDEMQGYFVSRPVPAYEFEELLLQSTRNSGFWNQLAA